MSKNTLIILGCTLFSVNLNSFASGRPTFEDVDTNGDGKISRDEFVTAAPSTMRFSPDKVFDRLDADDNGFLNQDEFNSRPARSGRPK